MYSALQGAHFSLAKRTPKFTIAATCRQVLYVLCTRLQSKVCMVLSLGRSTLAASTLEVVQCLKHMIFVYLGILVLIHVDGRNSLGMNPLLTDSVAAQESISVLLHTSALDAFPSRGFHITASSSAMTLLCQFSWQ